jgi:3'(2'), 5'-bisphosphate nucleotidase
MRHQEALLPTFDHRAGAELLQGLTALGIAAAAAVRRLRSDGGVRVKSDGSPVTAADEAAEAVIRDGLARLAPEWPVVSEEAAELVKPAVTSAAYFLVDPLDGTREFVAGRDEYTINIAAMADGAPVLGIVAAPALGTIWRGMAGRGADRLQFSADATSAPQTIHVRTHPPDELTVLVSRSHLDAPTRHYLDNLPPNRRIACGSSLKFCRLAEGTADHYPRLGPTCDWDVAAGHAVLTAAGGSVVAPDGAALVYGTADLRIPAFLAWGGTAPTGGRLKAAD